MPTLSDIFGGDTSADTAEQNDPMTADGGFDDAAAGPPEADPGIGQPVEPPPFDPDTGGF